MARVCPSTTRTTHYTSNPDKYDTGTWAFPGGHLEFNEDLEDCAQREIKEETDLDLVKDGIQFITATNDIMKAENKHYITIYMAGRVTDDNQVPKVCVTHSLTFRFRAASTHAYAA